MIRRPASRSHESALFHADFVAAGRATKAQVTVIMALGLAAMWILRPILFNQPHPLIHDWAFASLWLVVPAAIRVVSCLPRTPPPWSTGLFIASVYLDVITFMVIRSLSGQGGYDEIPILIPIAYLASLLVVHIRFVVLVPAMLVGFATLAIIEAMTIPITSASVIDIGAAGAIFFVPLASSWLHERQTELGWVRERRLNTLSTTDELTRLPNRRAFDHELQRALTDGPLPVSLAILDVDRFKVLNDALGHAAGDRTLAAIGRSIADSVDGPSTFTARLSGEEFVVVWSGDGPEAARAQADRVRGDVASLQLPSGRFDTPVTASAGFASLGSPPEDPARAAAVLTATADAALYRAKHDGRNRLVAAATLIPDSDPTVDARLQRPVDEVSVEVEDPLGEHDRAFLADFDRSGLVARRVIMAGIALIVVAVAAVAPGLLALPDTTVTTSRVVYGFLMIPAAVVAIVAATWRRLRPWAAVIHVVCVAPVIAGQMWLRASDVPHAQEIVTFLMPVAVLLSLGVVQIRFRLMFPAMVVLYIGILVVECLAVPAYDGDYLAFSPMPS